MRELSWHDLSFALKRSPRRVLELLKSRPGKVFVGGGFVRSVVAGESINDMDLFCGSEEEALECARFLLGLKEGEQTRKIHRTENAYTVMGLRLTVQIIHRWTYASPEQLMQSFDFTIAMAGFWWEPQKFELLGGALGPCTTTGPDGNVLGKWRSICDDRFYEDLAAKRLRYTSPVRNEDAGGSLLRVLKFYQRGYRIPLDCLGAVLARLVVGVDQRKLLSGKEGTLEKQWAKVLSGLLREVDPNIDPAHIAHLPALEEEETNDQSGTIEDLAGQARGVVGAAGD